MGKIKNPQHEQYVITIRLEEFDSVRGTPVILRNLTIYDDLHYRIHVENNDVPIKKFSHITHTKNSFQYTSKVLNVLANLNTITYDVEDTMATAAELLLNVKSDSNNFYQCQFVGEQLRLASTSTARRYSSNLLSAAIVWERTSPSLYEHLYNSHLLVLPHKSTLRRLTSALTVKEGLEAGTINYLKMRVSKLETKDKLVNLAMDEVYTARIVELAGGRVFGDSENGVTNTLFCTHISYVAGKYEDLVSMSPVPHIKANDIKEIFLKVLKSLTVIGFTVVSVTTDGHRTNQSFHNALGHDGVHPEYIINPYSTDSNSRIYTMYDSVHLFKNMYFNLLNKKTLTCPSLSDAETNLHVQFNHLLQVHNMEQGKEVKMAYRLTDKVLHPSTIERVNVQLAVSATHETTIAALDYYGQKEERSGFKETAEFLRSIRKWFDIVNVKTPTAYLKLNDNTRKPVTKEWRDGIEYLEKFG